MINICFFTLPTLENDNTRNRLNTLLPSITSRVDWPQNNVLNSRCIKVLFLFLTLDIDIVTTTLSMSVDNLLIKHLLLLLWDQVVFRVYNFNISKFLADYEYTCHFFSHATTALVNTLKAYSCCSVELKKLFPKKFTLDSNALINSSLHFGWAIDINWLSAILSPILSLTTVKTLKLIR